MTERLSSSDSGNHDYLFQIEHAFQKKTAQNQILSVKLGNYRSIIQNTLLIDFITSDFANEAFGDSAIIDQLFDCGVEKELYTVYVDTSCSIEQLPERHAQDYFKKVFSGKSCCIVLELKPDYIVLLINYVGNDQKKTDIMQKLLNTYYEETGCPSVISHSSSSPLDIPALYNEVMQAGLLMCQSSATTTAPISLAAVSNQYFYPQQQLEQLNKALYKRNFAEANLLISDLFDSINSLSLNISKMPLFFIHCVLIDMLVNISDILNKTSVKYDTYAQLVTETLYFIRSYPYTEKKEKIQTNFFRLIKIYEQKTSNNILVPAQIIQEINENALDSNFSIAFLADQYHTSISYMSNLIKNELGQSFSDYRWTLRLNRAKQLLTLVQLPVIFPIFCWRSSNRLSEHF
ncbi:MAG: helix-turn-helix transcriptional regulator [Lachnospiraceae bacterium]|nr:helix-turn-helix transcriptional regulator [Lachnospiraceae bacterium]